MRQHLQKQWPVYFIILLAVISRVPQLLSSHFIVDGDEAIVGLMSKHFIEGKGIPWFFYGQQYGFAFIEVLAISFGYSIAGISDYTVKLSVFALWIAGVIFLYKSLLLISKGNKTAAILGAVLFILSPAWAVWSMKARGGYITSFLLSSIIVYLSILSIQKKRNLAFILIGLSLVISFYSQPLWLPGILPFVILGVVKHQPVKRIFLLFAGVISAVIFFLLIQPGDSMWHPQVLSSTGMNSIQSVLKYQFQNLTGYYYLQEKMPVPASTTFFVYVFAIAAVFGVLAFIAKFKSFPQRHLLAAAALSLLASISYLFFINLTAPRYALPLFGFALVFLFIIYAGAQIKLLPIGITSVLIIAGLVATLQFKNYKLSNDDRALLIDATQKLKNRKIHYVFSTDPLLQWHISFYSKEYVIGRYFPPKDRYMPYVISVDSAYNHAPEHTAIIAKGLINADNIHQLNAGYAIYPAPEKRRLMLAGFQLN